MFSELFVCPQGGLSLCPGEVSLWGMSMSRGVSRGVSVQGEGSVQGVLSRGVSVWGLCPGVSVQGSLSRGSLSRGVSVWEGLCQGDPGTVMSGLYASYWNAFLFYIIFPSMCLCCTEMSSFMCYVID